MRKKDLPNCPKWLLDADTFNEYVEFLDGIIIWRGGQFLGGQFLGGEWLSDSAFTADVYNSVITKKCISWGCKYLTYQQLCDYIDGKIFFDTKKENPLYKYLIMQAKKIKAIYEANYM
ncbi:MAG: hypothetical protein ACRCZ9_03160 [Fusobacteriaceae bacterium]